MQQISLVPKISINPLVEYIGASERRKHSIIKQQKNPSDFIIARYRTARFAFAKYFKNGYDATVIINAIDRLQHKENKSTWTRNDTKNSIEALRNFLQLNFPFKDLKCRFVTPDLLLEWEKDGKKFVGAIKFYIKKKPLSHHEGFINASLIADFLKSTVSEEVEISKMHCICIDIMNPRIFTAPKNSDEYMDLVTNACEQIRSNWLVA